MTSYIAAVQCVTSLQARQNIFKSSGDKKGLMFVGMLVFESFFAVGSWSKIRKKMIQKMNIPKNVKPFFFREGFTQ